VKKSFPAILEKALLIDDFSRRTKRHGVAIAHKHFCRVKLPVKESCEISNGRLAAAPDPVKGDLKR
jgi:hypothetical protein